MNGKLALGIALALVPLVAQAATRQDLETSAVISGAIVLAKDGSVQSVEIPDAAKYGQPIVQFVHDTAMKWRFVPVEVNGEPVAAKTFMHTRVVLKNSLTGITPPTSAMPASMAAPAPRTTWPTTAAI